jgi:hypothetical protein
MKTREAALQIQVTADSEAKAEQVRQLLDFYLAGLGGELHRIDLGLETDQDPLGRPLFHCRLQAHPWRGQTLHIEEHQADLVLAVTRVLDRCARALRRQRRYGLMHSA